MGVRTLSPSMDQKALGDFLVQVHANGSETASPTPQKRGPVKPKCTMGLMA